MRDYREWESVASRDFRTHFVSAGKYKGDAAFMLKDNAKVVSFCRTVEELRRAFDRHCAKVSREQEKRQKFLLGKLSVDGACLDKYDAYYALVYELGYSREECDRLLEKEGLV